MIGLYVTYYTRIIKYNIGNLSNSQDTWQILIDTYANLFITLLTCKKSFSYKLLIIIVERSLTDTSLKLFRLMHILKKNFLDRFIYCLKRFSLYKLAEHHLVED